MRIIEQAYAPDSHKAPHAHDLPSVSMVVAGAFRERMGRTEEVIRPLSISVMPAGIAHADVFSADGARLLAVHFDAASTRDFVSEDGTMHDWRWIHGGPGVRLFVRLLAAVRNRVVPAMLEVLVADVLAATVGASLESRSVSRPPQWLAHVRAAIDDCATWPSVADLAGVGGVHRVHLAKQFQRFYGCAVSDYVRRRSVQRAAQHMLRSTASLSEVAHESGFSDQPHLCRSFRNETGLTPSAFRALAHVGDRESARVVIPSAARNRNHPGREASLSGRLRFLDSAASRLRSE